MRSPFRKILFASDMSDKAREAYAVALDMAELYKADITVLHVMEHLPHMANVLVGEMLGKETWERLKKEHHDQLITNLEAQLAAFCSDSESENGQCRLTASGRVVVIGKPHEEILRHAVQVDADLIVMGGHGWGSDRSVQIGTTAKKVLSGSHLPVVIVK